MKIHVCTILILVASLFNTCHGQFQFPLVMQEDSSDGVSDELPTGFQFIGGLHVPRRTIQRRTSSIARTQTRDLFFTNFRQILRQILRNRFNIRGSNELDTSNMITTRSQQFTLRQNNIPRPQLRTINQGIPALFRRRPSLQQRIIRPNINLISSRFQTRPRFSSRRFDPWFLRGR